MKIPKLLDLFLTFFKIGAFTIGGGYVMIPLMQKTVSEDKGWITQEEIMEMVAISESTPGPLAINTATFVGYRIGHFLGAFLATLAVVLPSFVIIVVISSILSIFQENIYVKYAFMGVRAGVLAVMIRGLWSMLKKSDKSVFAFFVMFASFLTVLIFHVNVILIIIACGLLGLFSFLIARRCKK